MYNFKKLFCKIGIHDWKLIFIGCPINFDGFVDGKSCQRCFILRRTFHTLYIKRPNHIPMNVHTIQASIPIKSMSNKEKQFYLRNLNNKDNIKS